MSNITPVVKNIILVNVLFFIATYVAGFFYQVNLINILGIYYPTSLFFKPYQIVTHFFMHGGLTHIFFNMFALASFGGYLENNWGGKRFLVYYLVCALGATLTHFLFNTYQIYFSNYSIEAIEYTPLVGASGAIFGVLMGFGMLYPNAQLMLLIPPIPVKGKYIAVIALVLGVLIDSSGNVAHFAHLGGMIFGYFLLRYWSKNRHRY